MPVRPARIGSQQDLLHVVNQAVLEINKRIDSIVANTQPHRIYKTSSTLNFGTVSANSTTERTLNVIGASQQGVVHVSPQLTLGNANLVWSAYIPATNQVTVRLLNPTGSGIAVNTVSWNVAIIQGV